MEELPWFERLKKEMPGVRIILVNLDFEKEVKSKVVPLVAIEKNQDPDPSFTWAIGRSIKKRIT